MNLFHFRRNVETASSVRKSNECDSMKNKKEVSQKVNSLLTLMDETLDALEHTEFKVNHKNRH